MTILSWNVGTIYHGSRQSFFFDVFNKHVRYGENSHDIYCLQEVPLAPPSHHGKYVHAGCFAEGRQNGFLNDYYIVHSVGNEYCMITLLRKSLFSRPSCETISINHNFPFAQKILLKPEKENGFAEFSLFNVHLISFKKGSKDEPEVELVKVTKDRNNQIRVLEELSKDGDYFCGDFNMIRKANDNRPGMNNSVEWLKIAGKPGETYFKFEKGNYTPEKGNYTPKEYDYIGVRCADQTPPPFDREVSTPGRSGSIGSWRHHPIVADISIA